MESTNLSWRALARRQWPTACALLVLLTLEIVSGVDSGSPWQAPGVVVVCVIAVLAPRRPFDAALTAAAAVVVNSLVLRLGSIPIYQPLITKLAITETAALMALIAVVVREAPRWRSVLGVVALVAATVSTWWLRPNFQADWGNGLNTFEPQLWPSVIAGTVMLIISVGTGLYFRSRDGERRQSVEAEVLAAQHSERMALARELHDVVAHYVTSIVVHSQAAEAVLEVNPDAARDVLPVITTSGTEALAAMRKLVGTLRGSEPAGSGSVDSTSNLAADVRAVTEQSGLPVHLEFDLTDRVPPEFERSVLRLVQESLTNSRKHATDVTRVEVAVATKDDAVHIRVADNGRGTRQAPVGGSGGYGLVGMRERVELLGGTFTAGARPGGGWEVRARIPIAH